MITNFLIIYFAFSLVLVGICKQYNLLVDNKIENIKNIHQTEKLLNRRNTLNFFFSYYFIIISKNYSFCYFDFYFFCRIVTDLRKIYSVSTNFFTIILIAFHLSFENSDNFDKSHIL